MIDLTRRKNHTKINIIIDVIKKMNEILSFINNNERKFIQKEAERKKQS